MDWKKAPSYSTIRNIIQGVSSEKLEKVFRGYSETLSSLSLIEGEQVELSFDGKVIRGSFDNFKDQTAIQFLTIFCRNNSLILAHEEVKCKTNEIPVAQKIIEELNKKNVIYTCDAMSCQTKTLKTVKDSGSDIIVQVKKNQKTLLNKCIEVAGVSSYLDISMQLSSKEHGRIESRTATTFSPIGLDDKWKNVRSIIEVKRQRTVFNTKTKQWKDKGNTSYYISTINLSAERCNEIIRGHWAIENVNHNVKDVAMTEDASRIRVNPQNIARLRSFALNIMRFNKEPNINLALYQNMLNFDKLIKYKGLCKC